jgi:hypothetical protein
MAFANLNSVLLTVVLYAAVDAAPRRVVIVAVAAAADEVLLYLFRLPRGAEHDPGGRRADAVIVACLYKTLVGRIVLEEVKENVTNYSFCN